MIDMCLFNIDLGAVVVCSDIVVYPLSGPAFARIDQSCRTHSSNVFDSVLVVLVCDGDLTMPDKDLC